jgi:PncC family amidohydrolase
MSAAIVTAGASDGGHTGGTGDTGDAGSTGNIGGHTGNRGAAPPPPVAERIARRLAERGETLVVAETAAGGLISAALLAIPGASAWFHGGVVAYSAAAKLAWLGLDAVAFAPGGAVSDTAARRLAEAAQERTGATWGLAEAGIAGPQTGRRSRKPPGLAYLAATGPVTEVRELRTGLDARADNQRAFAAAALDLLAEVLDA